MYFCFIISVGIWRHSFVSVRLLHTMFPIIFLKIRFSFIANKCNPASNCFGDIYNRNIFRTLKPGYIVAPFQ